MNGIPPSKITNLALGHLSPEDSLRLLEEIEKSVGSSERFELIEEEIIV